MQFDIMAFVRYCNLTDKATMLIKVN